MKPYQSKAWMTKQYSINKMQIPEIAKLAGCSERTISLYIQKFNLSR